MLETNGHKSAGKCYHHLNIWYFYVADQKAKGHIDIKLKLDCSLVFPGMTAGVCWISLLSGIITAQFSFEQEDE